MTASVIGDITNVKRQHRKIQNYKNKCKLKKTDARTATMLVTTRIVAVLFFLNCKKWDYTIEIYRSQAKLRYCEQ